ncbi:MAG: NAD(P)H-dependent oxidoreductase [Rhodospirillales bacterium]|nr:NAD(P)H-dependent oxidoreductase [Rhodospirillales bacterium]MBO6785471.1 NAD(P)H-dependent oxidoreductase [Rhodospirillales bacterium]
MAGKTLLIVGHVPSPNTQALRDAVAAGASSDDIDGVSVVAKSPFDTGVDDVLGADAVILGTTENLGYMSGAMKDFFDRTYYGVLEEKQGLPYALYVRAGLDGTGTIRGVQSIVSGLRWKAVREPLLLHGEWKTSFTGEANELGLLVAAGLEAGVF